MTSTTSITYHIYLNDRCLFKNLNQEEFDIIWGRIYPVSYTHLTLPTNREV